MSRPAYMGLGSTSAFPGPTYNSPGQNIDFPGRNSHSQTGNQQIRPLLAGIAIFRADPGQFRLSQCSKILARPAVGESRLGQRASSPAGLDLPFPGWAWSGQSRRGPAPLQRLGRHAPSLPGLVRCGSRRPSSRPTRGEIPAGPTLPHSRLGQRAPSPAGPPFQATILAPPRVLLHLAAGPWLRRGSTPGRLPQRARPPLCVLAPVATRPALAGQIRLILLRLCQQSVQVSIIIKLYCA
jgi:hypothetical protein